MDSAIIVAIISGLFSFFGVYISNRKNGALMSYRIEELEKKQDKHNSVIERVYGLEKKVALVEERVDIIEEFHHSFEKH